MQSLWKLLPTLSISDLTAYYVFTLEILFCQPQNEGCWGTDSTLTLNQPHPVSIVHDDIFQKANIKSHPWCCLLWICHHSHLFTSADLFLFCLFCFFNQKLIGKHVNIPQSLSCCLVLFNWYSISNLIKQRKAANSHVWEARNRECLIFLLIFAVCLLCTDESFHH